MIFGLFFQKSECIYQCKLSDLPNQFNSENSQTRMLLVCVLGEQNLPDGQVFHFSTRMSPMSKPIWFP